MAVLDSAVSVSVFEVVVSAILKVFPAAGSLLKVPVWLAATGALPVKVWPSILNVELADTVPEAGALDTVMVRLACGGVPAFMFQSL